MNQIDQLVLFPSQELIQADSDFCQKKALKLRRLMECARLTPEGYRQSLSQLNFYENRLMINQSAIDSQDRDLILSLALIRFYQSLYFFSVFCKLK